MKKYVLLVIVLLSIMSSCVWNPQTEGKLPVDESIKMKLCGSYAIPGMFSTDLKGMESSIQILERDPEGRILFEYSAYNMVTEKNETALLICQNHDDDYVYFYEDICYIIAEYNEETVFELKAKNDWNQPINREKSSRRKINVSLDLNINTDSNLSYKQIRNTVISQMKLKQEQILELGFVDKDVAGNEILYLCVKKEDLKEKYVVFVNDSYSISYLKIENDNINIDEYAEFKKNNDWVYGLAGIRG